jgi:hypothetical protein
MTRKRKNFEKYYQAFWGWDIERKYEVRLPDYSRCDCVTSTHAIEFDFSENWMKAIGQALNYARHTGKRAGIVLIIPKNNEKHWISLNDFIRYYDLPIDTWKVYE